MHRKMAVFYVWFKLLQASKECYLLNACISKISYVCIFVKVLFAAVNFSCSVNISA